MVGLHIFADSLPHFSTKAKSVVKSMQVQSSVEYQNIRQLIWRKTSIPSQSMVCAKNNIPVVDSRMTFTGKLLCGGSKAESICLYTILRTTMTGANFHYTNFFPFCLVNV